MAAAAVMAAVGAGMVVAVAAEAAVAVGLAELALVMDKDGGRRGDVMP